MGHVTLFNKFRLILEYCLQISPGDDVLIVEDETIETVFKDLMMFAAASLGANPQSISFVPNRRLIMKEFALFAGAWDLPHGETLPKTVLGALAEADCAILLGSDLQMLFSSRFKEILSQGKKILSLPYMTTEEMFSRLLPDDQEEIVNLYEISKNYFKLIDKAKTARISSERGTDITMELGQFKTNCSSGIIETGGGFVGGLEILPAGQVTRVPNTGSANGIVLIDRSIAAHQYSELHESIAIEVKDGWVTQIDGGSEAARLRDFLDKLEDPNLYNLTELGIGVNPRCKFSGEAAPAEDTHTEGTVSVALGCDVHLGGDIKAKAHMDSTSWFPTLELDGNVVVEKGRLVA
jgi:leucyl aminopeptidase (aminopeptidase T)